MRDSAPQNKGGRPGGTVSRFKPSQARRPPAVRSTAAASGRKQGRGETKQQAKQHASHQAEQARRRNSAGSRQGGGGQHSGATKFQRTSVCEETPLRHILLAHQDQVGSTKHRPQLDKHRRQRGEEKQTQTDQTDRPRQRSTRGACEYS